jgi:hypothetical protein
MDLVNCRFGLIQNVIDLERSATCHDSAAYSADNSYPHQDFGAVFLKLETDSAEASTYFAYDCIFSHS